MLKIYIYIFLFNKTRLSTNERSKPEVKARYRDPSTIRENIRMCSLSKSVSKYSAQCGCTSHCSGLPVRPISLCVEQKAERGPGGVFMVAV